MKLLNYVLATGLYFTASTYGQTINLQDYGAIPNDNIDDTQAINQALTDLGVLAESFKNQGIFDSRATLYFPSGVYDYNYIDAQSGLPQPLPVPNNSTLRLEADTKLKFKHYSYMLLEKDSMHIRIIGGIFDASDAASSGAAANGGGFLFENGHNIEIDGVTVQHTGGIGIEFNNVANSVVKNAKLNNNAYYGGQDKLGKNNQWLNSQFNFNGLDNHFKGRGLTIWGGNSLVAGNEFIGNSEYGIRIYASCVDQDNCELSRNANILIKDNYIARNWLQDIYLYAQDDLLSDVFITNNVVDFHYNMGKSDDPIKVHSDPANHPKVPVTIAGRKITFTGNKITNIGNDPEYRAIHVVNAHQVIIKDNEITQFQRGISFGMNTTLGSTVNGDHLIEGNRFNGVRTLIHRNDIGAVTNATFRNNTVISLEGSSLYAGIEFSISNGFLLDNNTFDGFYKGIIVNAGTDAVISRNKTVNSLLTGFQAYGNTPNVLLHNNSFN
ncbi:right-handed parallel beta-helix repeat-containing protein [Pseudoalteromonas rubra]|uniref:right-handed parallel beta-helix repeat-containing protein n=1 Tax=Pseudoalteromonas rubra TaxID=43658 RepID=UPI000F76F66F|nr:right-handed parallel beta-helix repeat-containing protein [Pseudoalteromonas rubra]